MELTATVQPWIVEPPDEPCGGANAQPMTYYAAPAQFCVPPAEMRLVDRLRQAAQTRDPMEILTRAAEVYHRAAHPQAAGQAESVALGNALADLAMTGRVAYGLWPSYGDWPANGAALTARTQARLPGATSAQVDAAVDAALDRAYRVAWALRGPASQRAAARAPLGWIAVSGEDDTPHRPVNLPAPRLANGTELEQFEIPVTTHGVTVRTRFLISSAVEDGAATPAFNARALPPDPTPTIPAGHEVILFLHGHSSSAEEALALIPHIHAAGLARGRKYAVISFDLPNSGYAQPLNHTAIAGDTYWSNKLITTPILDFTEDFVVAFVDALEKVVGVKRTFAGVIGGSLGGNLGLRLGRRKDLDANAWLRAGIVSWSPASVWDPMISWPISEGPSQSANRWAAAETPQARADYFGHAYDQTLPFVNRKPGELWYSHTWMPCKDFQIAASRIARREIYNEHFRRWHWRLGGEQLIFSHFDRYDRSNNNSRRRYEDNTVRHLLAAGEHDDFMYSNIYSATRKLAQAMVNTPGRSLFLAKTGHSMHIERPRFMAGQIVSFLAESRPPAPDMSFLGPLLLAGAADARRRVSDTSFLYPLLLGHPGT